jgi:hypothetical protein
LLITAAITVDRGEYAMAEFTLSVLPQPEIEETDPLRGLLL